jgi:hypothetical protein
MVLSVDATIDRMSDAIASAIAWVLKKGAREEPVALTGKRNFDRVVHASGHDCFDGAACPWSSENVRSLGLQYVSIPRLMLLLSKRPLAPVDPSVDAQVRTMEVVGAVGERLSVKPDRTAFAQSIPIEIVEAPYLWRHRYQDAVAKAKHSFRESELFCCYDSAIHSPVAVVIDKSDHSVWSCHRLLLHIPSDSC